MDCRERIVSQEYQSVILDFPLSAEQLATEGDFCYQPLDYFVGVVYERISGNPLLYRYIPQLYGLESFPAAGSRDFDPQPLEISGILTQQRPPLELTGRGTVLAVIDTGDGVLAVTDFLGEKPLPDTGRRNQDALSDDAYGNCIQIAGSL